ncbi:hypothetical protein FHS61_002175 [Altererythrobacter atlanticus]|uniref:Uncharacterized protein n=1 Tax=Croceibacterium atlanticum TaxID=1267766 RepID=A0A0F7KSE9_9SPHN|nr:hypothetical protein [Croceibacterium atlanticum]AKH41685.1 hypothetical protein WYH_00629 [Croceibacterium atlanticum]MBB5733149.1 hypothetical protein [Croceibacterium atlanticum]
MKLRDALILLAGCSLFCGSGPAAAQDAAPTGSRISRPTANNHANNQTISEEDRALRATQDFSRCAIYSDRAVVIEFLASYSQKLDKKVARTIMNDGCLSHGQLMMPAETLRGGLFRQLLIDDFADQELVPADTAVQYARYFPELESSKSRTAYLMLDFASCVVRTDPENSRAFVTAIPGEPQEEEALKSLIPQLGPCMPDGLQVEFSKSMLTSYFAEALYREFEAAAVAQQAKAE